MTRTSLPSIDRAPPIPREISNLAPRRSLPVSDATIDRSSRVYALRVVLLLAPLTLAVHGLALFDDKVLDDYWHQEGLREHGWSFSDLLRTLIIAPADFLHTWWQTKPVVWHYFRPFFILSMKFVFNVLGGGNPISLHIFSLVLHFASAVMVWRLCWLLTRDRAWSFIGGALFVIYPHSAITVSWPSSQNVVLQTTLLLATILSYVRASGLVLDVWNQPSDGSGAKLVPPPLSRPFLILTICFWLLALFTRENAALLPIILAALDLSFGGRRHLWARRRLYLLLLAASAAFMAWRAWLQIPPLPDVYCRRPDGDWAEYLPWLAAKFLHYICASIWIAPIAIGPTGRYNPWSEVPRDCALMLTIVTALALIYWRSARDIRGWWIWPGWIVLSILPVTAVVATPHSGYMCGVGWAVACALAPVAAKRTQSKAAARLAAGTTLLLALGAAFMTPVNRLQWTGVSAAERYLPSWVMVSPPPRETKDVFFINMPFINIYCKPNLVDRLGQWFEDVNVHVLTYAPDLLKMNWPTVLEQNDANRFTLAVQGQPYFSRLLGRFLLEAFRGRGRFAPGDEIAGTYFVVKILDADDQGIWKLQFTFPKPLNDPSYCFYLTSSNCGAARIRFMPDSMSPSRKRQRPVDSASDSPKRQRPVESASISPSRQRPVESASGAEPPPIVGRRPGRNQDSLPLTNGAPISGRAGPEHDSLPLTRGGSAWGPRQASQLQPLTAPGKGLKPQARPIEIPILSAAVSPPSDSLPIIRHMAVALGAPIQPLLNQQELSPEDWKRVSAWWAAHADQQALDEVWHHRHDFDDLIYLGYEIDFDRHVAGLLIKTDLYLSGPPFPGPRR